MAPSGSAGWHEDGIRTGITDLISDGASYDIVVTDATGGTRSMKADGFTVVSIPQPTVNFVTIVAAHPRTGVVEHYLFQLDDSGSGPLVWGSLKGGGAPFPKSSLYLSQCARP